MPKPNRYQANGKVYPNGTTMGRYVMRNGHWIDKDAPAVTEKVKKAAKSSQRSLALGLLGFVMGTTALVLGIILMTKGGL